MICAICVRTGAYSSWDLLSVSVSALSSVRVRIVLRLSTSRGSFAFAALLLFVDASCKITIITTSCALAAPLAGCLAREFQCVCRGQGQREVGTGANDSDCQPMLISSKPTIRHFGRGTRVVRSYT